MAKRKDTTIDFGKVLSAADIASLKAWVKAVWSEVAEEGFSLIPSGDGGASILSTTITKVGECYFCDESLTDDNFCHGCKHYICEGCDLAGFEVVKFGTHHKPDDHSWCPNCDRS